MKKANESGGKVRLEGKGEAGTYGSGGMLLRFQIEHRGCPSQTCGSPVFVENGLLHAGAKG